MAEIKWWNANDPVGQARFTTGLEVASMISGGFNAWALNLLDYYAISGNDCLLVGENPDVIPVLQPLFPNLNFFAPYGYSGNLGKDFEQDFNILFTPSRTYDVVLCNYCLEHVCRPSIFLENMNNLCKIGGYSITLTNGPKCPLHGIPIDCLRFLRDFFIDLCKYIPMELVAYFSDCHTNPWEGLYCAAVYQRLS